MVCFDVQQEKAKQDDGLSDLSDILGDLKGMALDMGSELDKSDNTLTYIRIFIHFLYVEYLILIIIADKTRLLIISTAILMSLTTVFKELINEHVTCFPNKYLPKHPKKTTIFLYVFSLFTFVHLKLSSLFHSLL